MIGGKLKQIVGLHQKGTELDQNRFGLSMPENTVSLSIIDEFDF